jgi:hypothetical protein
VSKNKQDISKEDCFLTTVDVRGAQQGNSNSYPLKCVDQTGLYKRDSVKKEQWQMG